MIDAYLARIGYTGPRTPTPELLRALHVCHLLTVPFENLDIHWNRHIAMDSDRFVSKIVDANRGGFCYELNGAFAELLRALGFEVTLHSARVANANGGFGSPFDHMALVVRANDGSRWLADVGFGESFLQPLRLDERGEQSDRAGTYRLIDEGDDLRYQLKCDGEFADEYLLSLEPHPLSDFAAMCEHQQYSPESHFRKKRICSLATKDGRVTLTDGKLVTTRNSVREERPLTDDEWARVLHERFGIK